MSLGIVGIGQRRVAHGSNRRLALPLGIQRGGKVEVCEGVSWLYTNRISVGRDCFVVLSNCSKSTAKAHVRLDVILVQPDRLAKSIDRVAESCDGPVVSALGQECKAKVVVG